MNSLNSILLEGNLTRNPEARNTPKGTPVCTFAVASNRWYRVGSEKQQEVSFFDVEAWSGLADRCTAELAKGRGVRVVGRLKQERWVDQEGKPRSHVKIVAEHVEFKPQFHKADGEAEGADDNLDTGLESSADDDDEDSIDGPGTSRSEVVRTHRRQKHAIREEEMIL